MGKLYKGFLKQREIDRAQSEMWTSVRHTVKAGSLEWLQCQLRTRRNGHKSGIYAPGLKI